MRGWLLLLLKKSKLKSFVRPWFHGCNTNCRAVKNWLYPQTSDTSLTSWRQPFCNLLRSYKITKWLPPWSKGTYHLFVDKVNFWLPGSIGSKWYGGSLIVGLGCRLLRWHSIFWEQCLICLFYVLYDTVEPLAKFCVGKSCASQAPFTYKVFKSTENLSEQWKLK